MIERPKPNWNLTIGIKKEDGKNKKVTLEQKHLDVIIEILKPQKDGRALTREMMVAIFNERFPDLKITYNTLNNFRQNNAIRLEAEGVLMGVDRTKKLAQQRGKTNFAGPTGGSLDFNRRNFAPKEKKEDNQDEDE